MFGFEFFFFVLYCLLLVVDNLFLKICSIGVLLIFEVIVIVVLEIGVIDN